MLAYALNQYTTSVKQYILERAKHGGHSTIHIHQQEERVSWYGWKHRLYALGVEELSILMARAVLRTC
jgi:hypothetical protein